jgi:hypothetical protein
VVRRPLLAAVLLAVAVPAACAWLFRAREWLPDTRFDDRTTVAPSLIPGAGNGLFAARELKAGEPIAQMGGRLVFRHLVKGERGYLFMAPPCARTDLWPFDALDGKDVGGRASKANFAPRRINGVATHFQNARGKYTCDRPYVVLEALVDIPRGAEILVSYGPDYDYDFMDVGPVRDHFCARAGVDCSSRFEWEP